MIVSSTRDDLRTLIYNDYMLNENLHAALLVWRKRCVRMKAIQNIKRAVQIYCTDILII